MRFFDIQVQINNPAEVMKYLTDLLILKAKAITRDEELFYASIINEINEWRHVLQPGRMQNEK